MNAEPELHRSQYGRPWWILYAVRMTANNNYLSEPTENQGFDRSQVYSLISSTLSHLPASLLSALKHPRASTTTRPAEGSARAQNGQERLLQLLLVDILCQSPELYLAVHEHLAPRGGHRHSRAHWTASRQLFSTANGPWRSRCRRTER